MDGGRYGPEAGDRVTAGGATAMGPWVPLAAVGPGRPRLARPILMVGMAVVMMLATWWAATKEPDPYSSGSAARATLVVWTSPPGAVALVTMAAGRFLVSVRAVAALYGRACPQGVEIAGFTGRFGWLPRRRRLAPGRVFLAVGVAGMSALPSHYLRVIQDRRFLMVGADAPWDEATVPGLVAWLARHGIEAVPLPPGS